MPQRLPALVFAVLLAASFTGCGGSTPVTPAPPPGPGGPPQNAVPSIDAITAQGRRPRQPPRFADLGEPIDIAATVRDAETPVAELVYQWSATAGTFTGSGRNVTWTAPAAATTPGSVTITLKVTENYGHPGQPKNFSHQVTGTETIALHDSAREVGNMAFQFLDKFSQPQTIRQWQEVMKDFSRSACPDPREYDDERVSVEDHIANYTMISYSIGPPEVAINFGGACAVPGLPSDACVSARVSWQSIGPNGGTTSGTDYLSAVYAAADARWWLCSSRYFEDSSFGARFYR